MENNEIMNQNIEEMGAQAPEVIEGSSGAGLLAVLGIGTVAALGIGLIVRAVKKRKQKKAAKAVEGVDYVEVDCAEVDEAEVEEA